MVVDAQPELYIGYHIPQLGSEDTYALEVLGELLSGAGGGSRTGRLYKALVLQKKLALRVNADAMTYLYPSLFVVTATPGQGKSEQEVEKAIYDEIARLQTELPTQEELTRVRNSVDADTIRAMRSNFRLADTIATSQHLAGT